MNKILNILFIEDSEDDMLIELHKIKKAGYDVIYERVETAESMLTALDNKEWDIILSDYVMPHFNGLEALKILHKTNIDLPFVIISGTIGEDVAVEAMKSGAHDYIMKNNLQRLVPAIEREIREANVRKERKVLENKKKEVEEALYESEKRYRRITEGITDYLYSVKIENGKAVETTHGDACFNVTGYTAQDFASIPDLWFNMIVPEDREIVNNQISKILEGIDIPPVEHRIRCKDGSIRWVSDTPILIKDAWGKLIAYDGVIKDITERKLAEHELLKFLRAVEQSPASIVITDLEGKIEYVNKKFTSLTGYTKVEALGKNPRILKSGEIHLEYYKKLWETILSGNEWFGEFQNKKKDGELYWEMASISPIITEGKITHFLAVKEDITSRKRSEAALLESERKYRIVADNTYNWEFWYSAEGKFIYCSPSCYRVTGFTNLEFFERPQLMEEIIHNDYKQEYRNHISDVLKSTEEACIQFKIIRKDGLERWIEHICHPVYDQNDIFMGRRGSNCDITEKKEADRKLMNAIISTEESERNHFAQELHDGLGPMLSTVKLYFQWLSENKDPLKRESIIGIGIRNIDDAIQAVRDISNKLSPRVLNNLGLIPALKYLISGINETQKIKININTDCEKRYDNNIELTMFRIISELINNTIKYAEATTVKIEISHLSDHVLVIYNDNGIGFNLAEIIKNKKGMGLSNIKQRIESLNGKIKLDTRPGKSLKVTLELPLTKKN